MNKIIIGYALLISVTLVTALIGVLKRKAMLNIGEIQYTSIKFWFKTLANPYIIMIFCISIAMFIATLILFSMITADKVLVMSWSLTVPAFLVTIFFNSLLLNEKFNPSKYNSIGLLLIGISFSVWGAWGYLK